MSSRIAAIHGVDGTADATSVHGASMPSIAFDGMLGPDHNYWHSAPSCGAESTLGCPAWCTVNFTRSWACETDDCAPCKGECEKAELSLADMNRGIATVALQKLEKQLELTDKVQAAVRQLQPLCFPDRGVLKVETAQLRIALQEHEAAGVPDSFLDKYRDRLRAANEAQDLLKRATEIEQS